MTAAGPTPVHTRVAGPRLARWADNFESRHGSFDLQVKSGELCGLAEDGSTFRATLPFGRQYSGAPGWQEFADAMIPPEAWGILLVRKGGFAIARMRRRTLVGHKIGQRHVQGRTKAGGQSQQRFARRRGNQAKAAFDAAADHAERILGVEETLVVTGGDRAAVAAVLADSRFARWQVSSDWLPVPDPRRRELDAAILDAQAARIEVVNADVV